ncbi:helix-turn-helix domain-containing protein [Streptomyces lasiicapitis]|uniref:helix-turn-helix domain-containing protein n=1 Tax=Streptomyces lasiicapitis TaxID=1923961 RepID=UPI003682B3CE
MSHDARTWVWDHSRSKGTARLVLALIADRCVDRRCIAYASVPALMKRANASRTAVRDALDKLILAGELKRLDDRKGPRGETYYKLAEAAQYLAEQAAEGGGQSALAGPESGPSRALGGGPEDSPGERIPAPGGRRFRPGGGTGSGPQNSREPKVNGKSSSSAPLIPAAEWQIDDATQAWLDQDGQLSRLGEHALRIADDKWRTYRAAWAPRVAAAWACDWRAWIAREHTPTPGRPHLRALPGGDAPAAPAGMTRAEQHTTALLAALGEPTGT